MAGCRGEKELMTLLVFDHECLFRLKPQVFNFKNEMWRNVFSEQRILPSQPDQPWRSIRIFTGTVIENAFISKRTCINEVEWSE